MLEHWVLAPKGFAAKGQLGEDDAPKVAGSATTRPRAMKSTGSTGKSLTNLKVQIQVHDTNSDGY